MNGFLLDTNCIAELVRPKPEPSVIEWLEAADEDLLFISVLTFGEIRKGIAALVAGARRKRLEEWLDVDLRIRFGAKVLPIDEPVAQKWGSLAGHAKHRGVSIPVIDGLLAATALHHQLVVVTRNTNDFLSSQTKVLNLWPNRRS